MRISHSGFLLATLLTFAPPGVWAGIPFEPITLTPTLESTVEPFILLADFETGIVVFRDQEPALSATTITIQHLLENDAISTWGVGSSLGDGSSVASLTKETAAIKDGPVYAVAASGTDDGGVEFIVLLLADEAGAPFRQEYLLKADDPLLSSTGVANPQLFLSHFDTMTMVPNGSKQTAAGMYNFVGFVEAEDFDDSIIGLPFATLYSTANKSTLVAIPPGSLDLGVKYAERILMSFLERPTRTALSDFPDGRSSVTFAVTEELDVIKEQTWVFPENSNLGDLVFDISLDPGQKGLTANVTPMTDSWRDLGRGDTELYSRRSLGRGVDDPLNNLEAVAQLTIEVPLEDHTWASTGTVFFDPTSPIPAVTPVVYWFSGPVDLRTASPDLSKGDADGNGMVEKADAKAFFTFFAGMTPEPEWNMAQADMDGDEDVDPMDRDLFAQRLAVALDPSKDNERVEEKGPVTVTRDPNFVNPAIGFLDWGYQDFPRVPDYSVFGAVDLRAVTNNRALLVLQGIANMNGFSRKGESALVLYTPDTGYTMLAETYDPDLMSPDFSIGTFFQSLSEVDDEGRFLLVREIETEEDGERFTMLVGDLDDDPVVIPPPPGGGVDVGAWVVE